MIALPLPGGSCHYWCRSGHSWIDIIEDETAAGIVTDQTEDQDQEPESKKKSMHIMAVQRTVKM
jgi:hypothetical protein